MARAPVQEAVEEGTVAELVMALTGMALHYRREHEDDDTIRDDLRRLILAGEVEE